MSDARMGPGTGPILQASALEVAFGAVVANRGVSVSVGSGEIVAVLGPNGAGKTTLLSAIMGLVVPRAGSVHLAGAPIDDLPTQERVRRGLVMVPEGRRVFSGLTVTENLILGGSVHPADDLGDALEKVFARFPILAERRAQKAGLMSGGEQQQLVIARALMAQPAVMMLDEPSLGLAPKLVDQVFEIVSGLRRDGVSVLLVEQNARKAASIADRIYLLGAGKVRTTMAGRTSEFDLSQIERGYFGDPGVAV